MKNKYRNTDSNIKAGDLLLTEQPFAFVLMSKEKGNRCDNCLETGKVLKCSGCQFVHYCGRACQRDAWGDHKWECANLKRVAPKVLPDAARMLAKIINRLARGDGHSYRSFYSATGFRMWKDLMSHYSDLKADKKRMEHFSFLCGVLFEFLKDISLPNTVELMGIYGRMVINSFTILDTDMNSIGTGVYLASSIVDHSCSPNAVATFDGRTISLRALTDLPCLDWDQNGEVTTGARDGAAHVLRCLKVWYDLPTDVLIDAVSLLDRFLTKMKVRPCHVPCITVACMNIAIDQYAAQTNEPRKVSVEELVSISQSACTAGDVARMSRVVVDKLALAPGTRPVTARDWLRLFARLLQPHSPTPIEEAELMKLLEIAICDFACANARTSELALVLLYQHLEQQLVGLARTAPLPDHAYQLFEVGAQLQAYCHMSDASLVSCAGTARSALARYSARAAAPQRQRLVWRLSERTLKVLRPTDRLGSLLPTIEEQHYAGEPHATPARTRSGSESSENEETSDWPRSPVLPVYCHE